MFGETSIVKKGDKDQWEYSGYWIALYGKGTSSFGNDYVRHVVIFGVDNSLSSHPDNRKNNILVLGGGDTFGINGSFGAPISLVLTLLTWRQNFAWIYIAMVIKVICLLIEK